ncbi:MAG: RDD family protein [Solirubrobacteraceae bacterium]|nr:RDD family protein [Solirubrobacteraceae bacterium]
MTQVFGGIVTRGVALSIDGAAAAVLFAISTVAISFIVAALGVADVTSVEALLGASAVWAWFVVLYFTICWTTSGQTVGMRMMGLKLVRPDGQSPSVCRSLVRYFGRSLSILLLFGGYLMVLVHPQRRALHDVIAGTYVVYADATPERVTEALAARHPPPSAD